jgi:hypothetical protein
MLAEARAAYSGIDVREASLPHLLAIPDKVYTNVLCSATLMHLHCDDIPIAITNLARILHTGGRLLISYQQSQSPTEREPDGRLFTPLSPHTLVALLHNAELRVLVTERQADDARAAIWWDMVVAEKPRTRHASRQYIRQSGNTCFHSQRHCVSHTQRHSNVGTNPHVRNSEYSARHRTVSLGSRWAGPSRRTSCPVRMILDMV